MNGSAWLPYKPTKVTSRKIEKLVKDQEVLNLKLLLVWPVQEDFDR